MLQKIERRRIILNYLSKREVGFSFELYIYLILCRTNRKILPVWWFRASCLYCQDYWVSLWNIRKFVLFVSEQGYANTTKKKNTFSRIQRIFKTSHRKEKHGSSSPRHGRATTTKGVPQRVSLVNIIKNSGQTNINEIFTVLVWFANGAFRWALN